MVPQDEQAPASPALNSPHLATEDDNNNNNSGTSTPLANAPSSEEGDEENEDMPLTLAASVVLSDLPQDASAALAETVAKTGPLESKKVVVRFKGVGSAPQLAQDVCKISASRKFEEVVRYLRRKLKCRDTDSVFLYVNSAFAPSLDEVVGNLHQCFKNANDQLVVAYSMTPAFG